MSKLKANPHCPVQGCKTVKPHADDPAVKGLIQLFASPEQMTFWVLHGMAELRDSIVRDMKEKKLLAWITRLRQPEELYIRTLYALFIASERELHHILSGEMPISLSTLYRKVNQTVFEGRGLLQAEQPGLNYGFFKPMDTLNDGAHVSFTAFVTCMGLARNPEFLPAEYPDLISKHLTTYCKYLKYMHDMFKARKSKQDVLTGVINLHRPAGHWNKNQN
ncbi:MAG: hypothetical protein WCC92_02720 [Candidatus Korobacteraceae bacterium]